MRPKESVLKMWAAYHQSINSTPSGEPLADQFGDNEKDVNELADLVTKGIKRATASSLWSLQKTGVKVPEVGGIFIVLDWNKEAICIVKTSKVTILPFNEISEAQALREGEGDKSLAYWKQAHIAYFKNEFKNLNLEFDETMPIVFEEFEKVFPL